MLSCRPKGIINSLKAETPWRCFTAAGDSRTVYKVGTKHTLLNRFALQLLTSFNYKNKTSPPPTPRLLSCSSAGNPCTQGTEASSALKFPSRCHLSIGSVKSRAREEPGRQERPREAGTRVPLSPSSHVPSSGTLIINSALLSHPLKRIFLPSSRPLLACSHFASLPPPASSPASTPSTCSPCS